MEPKTKITMDVERPQREDVWSKLHGKIVVIQEKGGIIVTGLFTKREDGFIKLKDATVTGRGATVKPDRIWIDRQTVAHVHEAVPVEKTRAVTT